MQNVKCSLLVPLLLFAAANLLAQSPTPDDAAAAAQAAAASSAGGAMCCGGFLFMVFAIVAIFALNIAMLIWVARDAKNRGMDTAIGWMFLVMFTSVIGLFIYIFSRPNGNLVACPHCNNKRLQASAKCPHCGNP
jgi:uncharacterized membrane protein YhaH (DUF805 family)